MRVLFAIAIFSFGCSSSSTNNSTDESGGSGGTDAATGGGAGGGSGGSGGNQAGSAGTAGFDGGLPEGRAGSGGGDPCFLPTVVINEISTGNVNDEDEDEFIELYNRSTEGVNLQDYFIDYAGADGQPDTLWSGNTGNAIPGLGFFVLKGAGFSGSTDGASFIANVTLTDAGGVRLRGAEGDVDKVAWGNVPGSLLFKEGNPAEAPAKGLSIGREPDGVDCNDNSFDFQADIVRTPGSSN